MEKFAKILTAKIPSAKNKKGLIAKRGTTGKYYCGAKSDFKCNCCDGNCGPTNGCNCTACQELDITLSGYIKNKAGYPAKLGVNGKYYCNRRILKCRCCNGYCGVNNRCTCDDCQYLDKTTVITQKNLDNVNCEISPLTGKYYCYRKTLTCLCHDGFCKPENHCNCPSCKYVGIQSDPKSQINRNGDKAILNKGKFYCGNKRVNCGCQGELNVRYCLPDNGCGCNCYQCGNLALKPDLQQFRGLKLDIDISIDVLNSIAKEGNDALQEGNLGILINSEKKIMKFTYN